MRVLSTRVTDDLAAQVEARAESEERTVAQVVRQAVKAWVGSTAPEGQVQAVDPPQSKPAPPKKERAPRQKRPVTAAARPEPSQPVSPSQPSELAQTPPCSHVWVKSQGSSGNVVRTCSGCGAKS